MCINWFINVVSSLHSLLNEKLLDRIKIYPHGHVHGWYECTNNIAIDTTPFEKK